MISQTGTWFFEFLPSSPVFFSLPLYNQSKSNHPSITPPIRRYTIEEHSTTGSNSTPWAKKIPIERESLWKIHGTVSVSLSKFFPYFPWGRFFQRVWQTFGEINKGYPPNTSFLGWDWFNNHSTTADPHLQCWLRLSFLSIPHQNLRIYSLVN